MATLAHTRLSFLTLPVIHFLPIHFYPYPGKPAPFLVCEAVSEKVVRLFQGPQPDLNDTILTSRGHCGDGGGGQEFAALPC